MDRSPQDPRSSGQGTGESPNCPIYIDGEHAMTLRGNYDELAAAFQKLVDDYVARRYPKTTSGVVLQKA